MKKHLLIMVSALNIGICTFGMNEINISYQVKILLNNKELNDIEAIQNLRERYPKNFNEYSGWDQSICITKYHDGYYFNYAKDKMSEYQEGWLIGIQFQQKESFVEINRFRELVAISERITDKTELDRVTSILNYTQKID